MATASSTKPLLLFSHDDGLLRRVQSALGPLGFQVVACQRARELLGTLQRQSWGLLVLDASSASEERAELIRSVRVAHPSLPLIVLLAQRDLEFMADALRLGADDVASVPLQLVELKARVLGRYVHPSAVPKGPATGAPAAEPADPTLLEDLLRFHETSLQKLLEFEREILQLRDRVSEISSLHGDSSGIGQRLMLVHPSPDLGDALRRAAHLHNMVVEQEFTGGSALDRLGEVEIDALICGAELPDIDGATVAASVRSAQPYVEAVLLTGWGTPEGHATWLGDGDNKPAQRAVRDLEDVVALAEHFADRRARRRAQKQLARVFRERHGDFMRVYAETKLRLLRALGRPSV